VQSAKSAKAYKDPRTGKNIDGTVRGTRANFVNFPLLIRGNK